LAIQPKAKKQKNSLLPGPPPLQFGILVVAPP
jgi:hypothetical protein